MPFDFDPTPPDPFDRIDYLMNKPFRSLGMGRAAPAEYRRPLNPEEFETLGERFRNVGMSGLRGLGWALSTPGDYTRGLLSGKAGERVSGRDLADQLGLTRRGDEGWGAWAGGLATDVITDPLTWLSTFGAKHATTAAGKALSKLPVEGGGIQGLSRVQRLAGFGAKESELALRHTPENVAHLMAGGDVAGEQYGKGLVASLAQEGQVQRELNRALKVGEPLGSLARFGLPWGIGPQINIGTRGIAPSIAGAMDWAGDKLAFGNMTSRFLGSILDRSRNSAMDEATQKGFSLPGRGTDVTRQFLEKGRLKGVELNQLMHPLIEADPTHEREIMAAASAVGHDAATWHMDPAIVAKVQPLGAEIKKLYPQVIKEDWPVGLKTPEYIGEWGPGYSPRQAMYGGPAGVLEKEYLAPMKAQMDRTRNPLFDVPGQESRINEWAALGMFGKTIPRERAVDRMMADSLRDIQDLASKGMVPRGPIAAERAQLQAAMMAAHPGFAMAPRPLTPAAPLDAFMRARLRERLTELNEKIRNMEGLAGPVGKGPIFSEDPVHNWLTYSVGQAKKQGSMRAVQDVIAQKGERVTPADLTAGTHMSLPALLARAGGFTRKPTVSGEPIIGALPEALRGLAPKGAPELDAILRAVKQTGPSAGIGTPDIGPLMREARGWGVPIDTANAVLKGYARGQMPEQLKGFFGGVAGATNIFRALAYPMWPASHIRNAMTAAFNMLRTDNPLGVLKSVWEQAREMRNPAYFDPAVAMSRKLQHAYGNVGGGFGPGSELAGSDLSTRLAAGQRLSTPLPLSQSRGTTGTLLGDVGALAAEGSLGTLRNLGQAGWQIAGGGNPFSAAGRANARDAMSKYLGIAGVGKQTANTLPAVRAGWTFGENIEDLFRGAQMKSMLRQGYSPQQAGRMMLKHQFEYGGLGFTPFERNVMRQVFPFYGFMRKNIPLQLETLATHPGLIGSQAAPMMQRRTQPQQDYIPQYLQSTLSVPAGPAVAGNQQFYSTFGMPSEEAFGRLKYYQGDPLRSLGESLMSYAGNINPWFKGMLEQLTNRQFWSGRQLSDLRPSGLATAIGETIGGGPNISRDQLINQIISNSPFTRFATTEARLMDPRKSALQKLFNLGTGIRVTDVDIEKQKAIELRDTLTRMMAAKPHMAQYTSSFVRPEFRNTLPPDELELMRTYATYQKQAAEHAKQRDLQALVR